MEEEQANAMGDVDTSTDVEDPSNAVEVIETAEVDDSVVDAADTAQEQVVETEDNGADESETAAADSVDEAPGDEAAADEAPVADSVDEAEVESEDALFEDPEPAPRPQSPFDRPGRWYVVHTQSGHEKKAQQNLQARTASMNMDERIYETVIPMEDVAEFRNGKKVIVQKKMFPGYLLVRAELDDDAWYVIRNTPSVVNFVGSGGKPSPLLRREVETFLHVKEEGVEAEASPRTKARLEYEMGETVRVKEGPFADFSGEIVEINEDQLKVKVLVNIFGRETPVELEFSQIARL